jgi:hypothetical protein
MDFVKFKIRKSANGLCEVQNPQIRKCRSGNAEILWLLWHLRKCGNPVAPLALAEMRKSCGWKLIGSSQ